MVLNTRRSRGIAAGLFFVGALILLFGILGYLIGFDGFGAGWTGFFIGVACAVTAMVAALAIIGILSITMEWVYKGERSE